MVEVLDDTSRERESQAPAPFFGSITRAEDGIEPMTLYAFAGVSDINMQFVGILGESDSDVSFAFHGVNGILAEVLDDPFAFNVYSTVADVRARI